MGRLKKRKPKDKEVAVEEITESTVIQLKDVLKDLPMDLVQNLPVLVDRLNAFITFYSAVNLQRLNKLTNYVRQAEEILFDEKNLLNLDNETLKENYKQAKAASLEILDLARKVSSQIPMEENKKVDEVYRLLRGLSPDSLDELKDQLISLSSKDDTENK